MEKKQEKSKSSGDMHRWLSVDGRDKEMVKRVWFSFAGINCVGTARVNEQSGAAGMRWSRRRPESNGDRCVREKKREERKSRNAWRVGVVVDWQDGRVVSG